MAPTSFWHGFADMHAVGGNEFVVAGGEGAWIIDEAGGRYLDATAALWYAAAGFGRRQIAEAAAAQMVRLHAYSTFGPYVTRPTLDLAGRLTTMAPMEEPVAFFTSGGSEAIETAAKLARRFWTAVSRPEKSVIITREHSYHGMAAYGTSLAGIPGNRDGYGTLIKDVAYVPAHDIDAVAKAFEDHAGRVAAFFAEPVIGAGGVYPPTEGYFTAIQDLCRQHDVLLVADEVVTGFGRTGYWFASERYGITPDIIVFAKAVTSGYVPLGGLLIGQRIQEPFWAPGGNAVFRHGYTYGGHATACAAAMANLDVLEDEHLVDSVRQREAEFGATIAKLSGAPLVREIRTVGFTAAIELEAPPATVEAVVTAARRHGVLTRSLRGIALHVSPPLTISQDELGFLVGGFAAALDEVAAA